MNNETAWLAQLKEREEALQKELKALEQQANELRNQPGKIEELRAIETQKTAVQNDIDKVGNEIKIAEEKQKIPEPDKGIGEKVLDCVKITVAAIGLVNSLESSTLAKIEPPPTQTQEIVCEMKNVEMHKPLSNNDTLKSLDEIAKEKINEEINSNDHKIILANEHSKIGNDEKKITGDVDPAKKWEKEIDEKEQAISEKYENKLKQIEKSLQKQSDIIEKKDYDKIEKETKTKDLEKQIKEAKDNIEKERKIETDKLLSEREILEVVKEAANRMEKDEGRKYIEEQHKGELKRQLERQRLLDAFNKNR